MTEECFMQFEKFNDSSTSAIDKFEGWSPLNWQNFRHINGYNNFANKMPTSITNNIESYRGVRVT